MIAIIVFICSETEFDFVISLTLGGDGSPLVELRAHERFFDGLLPSCKENPLLRALLQANCIPYAEHLRVDVYRYRQLRAAENCNREISKMIVGKLTVN